MIRIAVAAIAVAGLAGCSTGISSGGNMPSDSLTVQSDYRSTYEAATAQAERCLRGTGAYTVHGTVDDATRSALVRVEAPFTGDDVARVKITGQGDRASQVDILMWGRGIWNEGALHAMRAALIYQVPSCTTYMPKDPPAEQKSGK
ncbi:Lipoprotein [Bordetella tumbae]|uniref:BPTD_2524 family lipoprotein n=1 Tax=Bordetella tumbae TaxID=1649139 RepID=UPI0039EF353B